MGIRYEQRRKATNGPMIFFSNLRDEVFSEEIRSAFINGLSFYAYRFPGSGMLTYGSSESWEEGLSLPGFVIGRFLPELPIITIPYNAPSDTGDRGTWPDYKRDGEEKSGKSENKVLKGEASGYCMPHDSTGYEAYAHEVEEIINALKRGEGRKVVAARVIVREGDCDIADKFYDLCERFPEAFVFAFGTPVTGCWIGATPELLLEGKEGVISTMALAGTREALTDEDWDEKNIEEQQIVSDYICEVFDNNGLSPNPGEPYTKRAGNIEHICTEISARQPEANLSGNDISALLKELSPTPALCGSPKEFALREINELENFDRGCYGGFCGPYHSPGDFNFHVVLRCASVSIEKQCVYVGGGITALSNVETEWQETLLKSKTFFKE